MLRNYWNKSSFSTFAHPISTPLCPGAEIGRQAWLRAMCPYGRAGSSPAPGTKGEVAILPLFLWGKFQAN